MATRYGGFNGHVGYVAIGSLGRNAVYETITINELKSSGDWAEVFAEENSGNVSNRTVAVDGCSESPPLRSQVSRILAVYTSEGDIAEWSGLGVFQLEDGRYLYASGSCDTTGWD